MASDRNTEIFVHNLEGSFFLSKVLGLAQMSYNQRMGKFEQSEFLSTYGRCILFLWCWTATTLCVYYYPSVLFYLKLDIEEKKCELQRMTMCTINILHLWLVVLAMYCNHIRNVTLLVKILNSMIKCNRKLMKLIKSDSMSPNRFHTFTTIRIITSIVDIYLIYNRPIMLQVHFLEYESLIVCYRIVMMASFFEWHCIQTYVTVTVDTLNKFMEEKASNLQAGDYEKLSRLYTQLFQLKQATCRYYQPFAFAACAGLFRTVVMAFHTFQALFLVSKYRKKLLGSAVYTFKLYMVSGLSSAVDFVMICVMAEFLSTSAERYRWIFLMHSLKAKGEESIQRTIDMILRQSTWEGLNWVLATGHSISPATGFIMLDAVINLTVAFLIYDGGKSVTGYIAEWVLVPPQRNEYYLIVVIICMGSFVFHKIVNWCKSTVAYRM